MRGRAFLVVVAASGLALLPTAPAAAHPLGNFTVNHAHHLLLTPDAVRLDAVVDRAEIPTAQALQDIAPDGTPEPAQLSAAADAQCAALADDVRLTVDGVPAAWTLQDRGLELVPGEAGLPTLRLTCRLRAAADLTGPATVAFTDDHLDGRVGWREITADGDGVRLHDSPVPVESPSDMLRDYPDDLLSSPVDVRSLEVAVEPGENTGSGEAIGVEQGDPFGSAMAALDQRLKTLVGGAQLTPVVGALAIALALLLGSGHALLPGHGKTVMAAYLAGRAGRPRDAVTVGATVTLTHTVGVLVLGAAVSLSSAFAGDQVLRWLGVLSGLLVAVIGGIMLRGALRVRRTAGAAPAAALPEPAMAIGVPALAGAGGAAPVEVSEPVPMGPGTPADGGRHHHHHGADHDHGHDHDHDHGHDHRHDHDHGPTQSGGLGGWLSGGHTHGPGGHAHGPRGHTHAPGEHTHGPGRGGLIGMGVAGGLVPSPSALVVLMASIGLGRTIFGVVLVIAYGVGMALTLTAVGLALVGVRDRLDRRLAGVQASTLLRTVARTAPVLTAGLVLVVGVSLMLRGIVVGA